MKKKKTAKPKTRIEFPIWATLFTIVGFSLLCSLGFWQVQRMEWKTEILQELEQATQIEPLKNRLTSARLKSASRTEKKFVSGYVVGQFQHDKEIVLGPRTYKGLAGYHLITPLRLEAGGILLINRGWLPEENINPDSRQESLVRGMTVITGIARKPDEPNPFTPDNNLEKKEWYWLNIDEIGRAYNLRNIEPYVLYEKQVTARNYNFPLPLGMTWVPPNNHKQYAFFWFSMAGLLIVFYVLRFIKK